jgi:hypothetical protein
MGTDYGDASPLPLIDVTPVLGSNEGVESRNGKPSQVSGLAVH